MAEQFCLSQMIHVSEPEEESERESLFVLCRTTLEAQLVQSVDRGAVDLTSWSVRMLLTSHPLDTEPQRGHNFMLHCGTFCSIASARRIYFIDEV